jgi:hypothetical protein
MLGDSNKNSLKNPTKLELKKICYTIIICKKINNWRPFISNRKIIR